MQTPGIELDILKLKRQAKALKKELGIMHNKCLDLIAKNHGYKHWSHLMRTFNNIESRGDQ